MAGSSGGRRGSPSSRGWTLSPGACSTSTRGATPGFHAPGRPSRCGPQSYGFPPSTSGSVPRAMPALRWQATHSWEDDNLVLCCIADLVVPAERTAERQPKNRGKDLLVHAPQCRPLRSAVQGRLRLSPVPRIASACGYRASCLDHGFFSSRSSKAEKSSHIETMYLNSRDLEAVSSCLSCPGDRSDHAHCSTRNGLSLATEGTVGGFSVIYSTARSVPCYRWVVSLQPADHSAGLVYTSGAPTGSPRRSPLTAATQFWVGRAPKSL